MTLPAVARLSGGRALARAGGAAALVALVLSSSMARRQAREHQAPPAAEWASRCSARLNHVRGELRHYSRELGHVQVRVGESQTTARAELILPPQYMARIEYRADQNDPPVFDWEEAPTPVAGSFALHRRVGRFDLTVVADDSDERGLRFAATMQPLLDQCLMDAE
jgi:hypothetical protein